MSGPNLLKASRRKFRQSKPDCRNAVIGIGVSSKVRDCHRDRLAVVYVRQSSMHQVLENRESRERQYALPEYAQRLGWPKDRVLLIDEDQGLSGKTADNRAGFQRLLAEVALNHVGLVLGLELSRLARSSKDWHHLVEVCAVFDTILGDQDGIYDANDSNDRPLLGMKGAMSEYELITLRNRLERGRVNKAQRGELFPHVPIGYFKTAAGEVTLEPDEQAQAVVRLVFDKFEELGTAWGVFRYLIRNKIRLGFRRLWGPNRGRLDWHRPQHGRILAMLRHPMYAGAYVYGRRRRGRTNPTTGLREGQTRWLPPEEIRVLLHDRVPAYISWNQYLANCERLRHNRSLHASKGAPRRGEALLAGLVVCTICGRRLRVAYRAKKKPYYACDGRMREGDEQSCCHLQSQPVDELVARQVLRALEPASLELSLRAEEDAERERERLHSHWRQRLERASYEAGRLERQYQAVEPENRLVARTLEGRWEQALRNERQLREEYERFLRATPSRLDDADRTRIQALSLDVTALWEGTATTAPDRKEIIRCLVDKVVVQVNRQSEYADVTIHWHGGFTSRHEIVRPVGAYRQLRDVDRLYGRIRQLYAEGRNISGIAKQLNQEGFSPPRRRNAFSVQNLPHVMKRLGLLRKTHPQRIPGPDEWRICDLARELEVIPQKVYSWAKRGWVISRRTPAGNWIVWADRDELMRLRKLKAQNSSWTAARVPELTIPKIRPS